MGKKSNEAKAQQQLEKLFDTRRWVYYVGESEYDKEKGYKICIVFENTPGYFPTGTDTKAPWFAGHDLDAAEAIVVEMNARRDIDAKTADIIVATSMSASSR